MTARRHSGASRHVSSSDPDGESALYAPIKAFLEAQDYEVKGEVEGCDVVATRGDESPVVVELKQRFNLELVLQGIERQRVSDRVYLALPLPFGRAWTLWNRRRRAVLRLCRRLGLGLLVVHRPSGRGAWVEPVLDPGPYRPRPNVRGRGRLLREFQLRVGDPNRGGTNRRPLVTAYRQQALRCANELREGPLQLAMLRERSGISAAARIAQRNVYGWFERTARGVYALTPTGREALARYSDVLEALAAAEPAPDSSPGVSPRAESSPPPQDK
jgi:hypothetical protein